MPIHPLREWESGHGCLTWVTSPETKLRLTVLSAGFLSASPVGCLAGLGFDVLGLGAADRRFGR